MKGPYSEENLQWFHFVKEQTVNVTIYQPLYCNILSRYLERLANCYIDSLCFDKVKPPRKFNNREGQTNSKPVDRYHITWTTNSMSP